VIDRALGSHSAGWFRIDRPFGLISHYTGTPATDGDIAQWREKRRHAATPQQTWRAAPGAAPLAHCAAASFCG
jgi:hypothetical protein